MTSECKIRGLLKIRKTRTFLLIGLSLAHNIFVYNTYDTIETQGGKKKSFQPKALLCKRKHDQELSTANNSNVLTFKAEVDVDVVEQCGEQTLGNF